MEELPLSLLKYRLIGASSEDPEHPLFSIMSKTPLEGWNSVRFCCYPQEILIQFPFTVHLRQLNILFHQTKIPSKLDIYYFLPQNYNDFFADYNSLIYDKIGYIIPNTNIKSDYQARELKKVFLNQSCLYLKLVFHKSYNNIYNPFNQVGLISLDCFGFALNQESTNNTLFKNINPYLNNIEGNLDQYTPIHIDEKDLDEVCVNKINEIKIRLNSAVEEENYDLAKVLSEIIEQIKLNGMKIKNLTDIKLKSIEVNDYENAKIMKNEIDRIKSNIQSVTYPELLGQQQEEDNQGELQDQNGEQQNELIGEQELENEENGEEENNNEEVPYDQQMEGQQQGQYEDINKLQGLSKSEEIQRKLNEKRRLIEQSKNDAKNNILSEKKENVSDIKPMTGKNFKEYVAQMQKEDKYK